MGNSQNDFQMISSPAVCRMVAGLTITLACTLILLAVPKRSYAQTSPDRMAKQLRQNTVRIKARENGFGFIVGEGNGQLYIATARHVIVGEEDNPNSSAAATAQVFLYSDQGKAYTANVLGTHEGDLAVLRLPTPAGFQWVKSCLATTEKQQRGTQVWFVGKKDEWYVPAQPGSIASDQPSARSLIEVDGLPVSPGTSGAPLIADSGIVAMIETDSAYDTRALTLDFIKRAFLQWNYPWDLREGVAPPHVDSVSEPPAAAPTCSVSVDSDPSGASVLVDNVSRGTTPTTVRLSRGRSYSLALKMDNYRPHEERIDCDTQRVSTSLEEKKARITIVYTGDYLGCSLGLDIRIGDKRFRPSGSEYSVTNVPLGDQNYEISGQISCQAAGVCAVYGSGSIDVRDGGTYAVGWVNSSYARCSAALTAQ